MKLTTNFFLQYNLNGLNVGRLSVVKVEILGRRSQGEISESNGFVEEEEEENFEAEIIEARGDENEKPIRNFGHSNFTKSSTCMFLLSLHSNNFSSLFT